MVFSQIENPVYLVEIINKQGRLLLHEILGNDIHLTVVNPEGQEPPPSRFYENPRISTKSVLSSYSNMVTTWNIVHLRLENQAYYLLI